MPFLLTYWRQFAAAFLLIIAFTAGWKVQGWRYEARLRAVAEQNIKDMQRYQQEANIASKRLQEAEAKTKVVYREITKEIPHVTDNRVCFADNNALVLWNNALAGSLPKAATGTSKEASGAVTDATVLENAVANFEQYKQVRDQLNALIDWIEAH